MRLNLSGQLSLLRVHDRGTKYGPPSDVIDVEVVVQFVGQPASKAYGFQLRTGADGPARGGMLDLLRDGFNHGWIVNIDYDISAGHNNGTIMRVWLTKPPGRPSFDGDSLAATAKRRGTSKRKGKSKA